VNVKKKLFVIDNNEEDRKDNLKNIHGIFQDFIDDLDFEIITNQVDEIEISNKMKRRIVWQRSRIQFIYSHKARRMLKMNFAQIIADGSKGLLKLLTNMLRYRNLYLKVKIEMYLTQKHIYCWRSQIQNEINFSLIVENDLHLTGNKYRSINLLKSMIESPNLIFFSHSVDPFHLMLDKVTVQKSDHFILLNKLLSNGSSGYSVPLTVAKRFVDTISKLPDLTLLPVDFMIVAIGLELEKIGGMDISTIFIHPSDFIHLSDSKFVSTVQII
jgi:hypothetical protein